MDCGGLCAFFSTPPLLQGKELLSQKIPMWQQACAEPNKLPDRALFLAQQMSGAAGVMAPGGHHPGMALSEPVPGVKALPVPPELAALRAGGAPVGQQVRASHREGTGEGSQRALKFGSWAPPGGDAWSGNS